MSSEADPVVLYGFTAVPADQSAITPATQSPETMSIDDLKIPSTALAERILTYAKAKLSSDTYRHSLRVYSYGLAIARQCFPDFKVTAGSKLEETWFLTAMMHDIGTTEEHLTATRLSYEFWAGVHVLEILRDSRSTGGNAGVAPTDQAESVAEAIFRHQDVQNKGKITLITRLIHLGTLLDNIGAGGELVTRGTIENVVRAYPRYGWGGCFKATVEKEKKIKPYTMVSRIEGFEEAIAKNTAQGGLMADFE